MRYDQRHQDKGEPELALMQPEGITGKRRYTQQRDIKHFSDTTRRAFQGQWQNRLYTGLAIGHTLLLLDLTSNVGNTFTRKVINYCSYWRTMYKA